MKRVSRQMEERLIVLSAEEDVDAALRNFEDAYLPACRVLDQDLALGDLDVAGSAADGAPAALLDKKRHGIAYFDRGGVAVADLEVDVAPRRVERAGIGVDDAGRRRDSAGKVGVEVAVGG